ncbi:hypothetical protein ACH47B_13060 [Rhodococcus sp. NPDC019627]|uniref:hypothetical protein n=1 Tax=unclassified Rhodococcus (in: high G+C Gram-positive bacteria) TaxID=192944 RepID=UPI0033CEE5FC
MSDRGEIANIIERTLRNDETSMNNYTDCTYLTDATLDGHFNLVAVADAIIAAGFQKVAAVEPCDYTFSHTRHWCGNPTCRES